MDFLSDPLIWIIITLVAINISLIFYIKFMRKRNEGFELHSREQIERKEEIIALLRSDMAELCAFTRHQVTRKSQEEFRFYFEMYGSADFEIPSDVYFVNSYVPVKGLISETKPFGDYTVYIPFRGECYHSSKTCSSIYLRAVHIYDIVGRYRPCPKCAKMDIHFPPKWYPEIKRIMENNQD